ncbi:hypothetical protein D3C75_420860 [compost metagenome]
MCRVQFDEVETGFTGVGDRLAEIVHDARDFVQLKGTRQGGICPGRLTVFITQRSAGARAQCGRGYRRLTTRLQAVVRDTAGVPQLDRDATLFSMYARGNFLPRGDLLRAVQARCASVAFGLERNLRGFRDDQT